MVTNGKLLRKGPFWKPCKVIGGKHQGGASGYRLLCWKVDETGSGSCPGGVTPPCSASRELLLTDTESSSQILQCSMTQREPVFPPCLCQSTDSVRKALHCDTAVTTKIQRRIDGYKSVYVSERLRIPLKRQHTSTTLHGGTSQTAVTFNAKLEP